MQKKLLKTKLFGFSKTEVCEYITRTNNEFNARINELIEEHNEEKNALSVKIASLTEEINKYYQANGDIARMFFDAKQYAEDLKNKADEDYRIATNELNNLKRIETEKLNSYREQIQTIKKEIAVLLSDIEGKLTETNQQNSDLIEKYKSEEGINL